MSMKSVGAWCLVLAGGVLLGACGSVPPARDPIPVPAVGAAAAGAAPARVPLPWPPAEDVELPSLEGLSDVARLALHVLQETEQFTGAAVGEGGETPVEVEAWRVLLRDPDGDVAFQYLVRIGGGRPAGLFGLCGLWFTDREAFEAAFTDALAQVPEDGSWTVRTFIGCQIDETPVGDILPEIRDGTFPLSFRGGTP